MKKSSIENEKLDMGDPNVYLKVFNDKVKINDKISMDSIEVVLSNMTNLHNTIGKSYEVVATILGTLLNQIKQQKSGEEERENEYSTKFGEFKNQVIALQKEVSEIKKRNVSLENELSKKDTIILKLKSEIDELIQKKKTDKKIEKEISSPESPILDELEIPLRDERETHSEGGHSSKFENSKKRKAIDSDLFGDDFNKDSEFEVQSEIDKFKFRKLFKKVKKTENPQHSRASGIEKDPKSKIFVPLESINKGHTKEDDSDDGNELHDLLNNFSESRGIDKKSLIPDIIQNLMPKEDSHSSRLAKDKLNEAKMLKKENGGNFFTQQGALNDSLERELFPPETSVLPLTSKDKSSQMMQKMMKSNQKRNTTAASNSFFKTTESQKNSFIESPKETLKEEKKSDPVPTRGVHRSKIERENLQGFECDQCQKFYNFIGDGTKIKPAGMCDKCSRHRDKFPLPSTPEVKKNYCTQNLEFL